MNFRQHFQISRVGASLFSGGAVNVLDPELAVCLCRIINSEPVLNKHPQSLLFHLVQHHLPPQPVNLWGRGGGEGA